jgi:PPIC-type PPIASE domain
VARVGESIVERSLVADVAHARGISPRQATQALIDDALVAAAASATGIDRSSKVTWSMDALRARLVVDRAREAAESEGPPSEDELRERAKVHWREVDLPEQYRVIHAVVLRPQHSSPETDARAKAIATSIANAVASAATPEDFQAKAAGVPHPGFDERVERLPAFVDDGRASEGPPDAAFDPTFAAAAASLKAPGATSDVIETKFGWHVIRLLERLPAHRLPLDELRARFGDEIRARRARKRIDDVLSERRAAKRILVTESADALLDEVGAVTP